MSRKRATRYVFGLFALKRETPRGVIIDQKQSGRKKKRL